MASRPIPTILIVLISFAAGWAMSRYFSATATAAPTASRIPQDRRPTLRLLKLVPRARSGASSSGSSSSTSRRTPFDRAFDSIGAQSNR